MYYVYILYSKKLRCRYIGFSTNLRQRVIEHNSGKCVSTSKGIPWKLIYYQCFLSEIDARAEEKFLKTGKGRERMKILLANTIGRVA